MPKKRRRKKEITVAASYFTAQKDALLGDTTSVEALNVFKMAEKIGKLLSGFIIAVGTLFFLLSVISILISIEIMFSNAFLIGTLALLGAMNIFCGLILLTKK